MPVAAAVPLPTATHPSFPCDTAAHLCLSCLSHNFSRLSLATFVSLYHTSLSVPVPLYLPRLPCLHAFVDCRLESPGQRSCTASACPHLPVTGSIETAAAERGKRNKYRPFNSSRSWNHLDWQGPIICREGEIRKGSEREGESGREQERRGGEKGRDRKAITFYLTMSLFKLLFI